jgi:hypothetical protein
MALEAIDAETFSSAAPLPEKFWRRHGQRSHMQTLDGHAVPLAKPATQKTVKRTRPRK